MMLSQITQTEMESLAENGTVMMPLAPSPFSEKFAWVADQFGVSWQLNLAKN